MPLLELEEPHCQPEDGVMEEGVGAVGIIKEELLLLPLLQQVTAERGGTAVTIELAELLALHQQVGQVIELDWRGHGGDEDSVDAADSCAAGIKE